MWSVARAQLPERYAALQWRMELIRPETLSKCADMFAESVISGMRHQGLETIYVASDMPLGKDRKKAKSASFNAPEVAHARESIDHLTFRLNEASFKVKTWNDVKPKDGDEVSFFALSLSSRFGMGWRFCDEMMEGREGGRGFADDYLFFFVHSLRLMDWRKVVVESLISSCWEQRNIFGARILIVVRLLGVLSYFPSLHAHPDTLLFVNQVLNHLSSYVPSLPVVVVVVVVASSFRALTRFSLQGSIQTLRQDRIGDPTEEDWEKLGVTWVGEPIKEKFWWHVPSDEYIFPIP